MGVGVKTKNPLLLGVTFLAQMFIIWAILFYFTQQIL